MDWTHIFLGSAQTADRGAGAGPKPEIYPAPPVTMGSLLSRRRRSSEGDDEPLEAAAKLIAKARSVVLFSGAGISVDSGIPDFRSPGGLWSRFDPGIYCHIQTFMDDPSMFWTMVLSLYHDVHYKLGGTAEELSSGEIREVRQSTYRSRREAPV